MMAMTTNSSIRVNADGRGRRDMGAVLSAGPGSEGWPRLGGPAADRKDGDPACPDARGRSIGTGTRQAGLLALGSWRPRAAFPRSSRSGVFAQGPGRSQRRPRTGIAPVSLFIPRERGNLSNDGNRVGEGGRRDKAACGRVGLTLRVRPTLPRAAD